jgi:hypothetical protein
MGEGVSVARYRSAHQPAYHAVHPHLAPFAAGNLRPSKYYYARQGTAANEQQRFQSYASLPPTSLNADQKAAVASLPVLTAQSRELEDLIKPGGAVEVSYHPPAPHRGAQADMAGGGAE